MPDFLPLSALSPRVNYCVMRDPVLHESILASGRMIQECAGESRDFRQFKVDDALARDYVRVQCDGFYIAVWRDPTRPELNVRYDLEPVAIVGTATLEESYAADRELAAELAADGSRDELLGLLEIGSRRAVEHLYAQS